MLFRFGAATLWVIAAIAPCAAYAQGSMTAFMSQMQAVPRPDQLPQPFPMTGIGNSHIRITATSEAQRWFDQGLSLLHDFWGYEAAKAFQQGVRVDPTCAMCYWGLFEIEYRRSAKDNSYALTALKRAEQLDHRLSKDERLYIEAAKQAASSATDSKQREIAVLRKLAKRNSADTESHIFLAVELDDGYTTQGEPKAGTREEIAILQQVLQRSPEDSAANHYWIHAIEPGRHPERALEAAAKLPRLAPNSGHMVHMPGHIYFRLGNYAEAERWFYESTQVDERYMREQHVGPDDDWNYVHNLMYSIADLMEEGKFREAAILSDNLPAGRGLLSASLYPWLARDQITRISNQLPIALRRGDWARALVFLGKSRTSQKPHVTTLAEQLMAFCTGMNALNQNDLTIAIEASNRLDASLWRSHSEGAHESANPSKPSSTNINQMQMAEVMPDADLGPISQNMSIASLELRAGILIAQGQLNDAKILYSNAMAEEHGLGYHEPPFYIRPVGETEGAALVKAHDYADAKGAFRSALEERPNSGLALYGLAQAEQLAGDVGSSTRDYKAFLQTWSNADHDQPEIQLAATAISQFERRTQQ